MNAVLHESSFFGYEAVYRESKTIEVSGDTVVSDRMPDIGILCDSKADVLLHEKRVENGVVSVQGEVRGTLRYIPDGKGGLCGLQLNLPWSAEFRSELIPQNGFPVVEVQAERVETKMLNPRKILFKAKLLVSVCVFDKQGYRICDGIEGNGIIQGRMEQGEYKPVSAVCERTFAATDEYPIPASFAGAEIIGKTVQFRVDDIKSLANKVIIKGIADSEVVLSSENGEVEWLKFSSPFSLIAETECEHVGEDVSVVIVPTAMYYEMIGGGRTLSVEVHGVCQMVVYEKKVLQYISDAFSNFYPCQCAYTDISVTEKLQISTHREKYSGSITCRSQVGKVCYVALNHKLEKRQEGGSIRFTVSVCVKYENGQYDWLTTTDDAEIMCDNGELRSVRALDVRTSVVGNEVEYHITFDCESAEENICKLRTVSEVYYDEEAPLESDRLSLIAVHAGGSLWDLAKRYSSTVEQIKTYNRIESDEVEQGTFLLIPRQRLL